MLRILLADEHTVVRRGLRGLLEAEPGWQVVAEAHTGRAAVARAAATRPDIAILALALPELHGLEATRRIRRELPGTEVLIFTRHDSERLIRAALLAGARGYLLKADAAARLVPAVAALARHQSFFSDQVAAQLLDAFLRSTAPAALTGRELEIVQLLAEGRRNKEVGAALGISAKTVETHRAAIMRQLGLGSLAALVRYAVRNGLIDP